MLRLLTLLLIAPSLLCFNISPYPNIIINKPEFLTFIPQNRSSYFGYSLNLRKNHILIGAPRAQSTLEQQRRVQETGAVYKCNFEDVQPCHPYHFDLNGNTHVENTDLAYNSEKKDFQMLGFAMDGNENENDRFVVCAPKLKADLESSDHYLLHGICYWVGDTSSIQPSGVRQIIPLRTRNEQTVPGHNGTFFYYYTYGESGFSVHISENNEEIIIGCPGILNWKGSIIRYRQNKRPDLGGISKREIRANPFHMLRKRQIFEYKSEVPSPFHSPLTDDSYFGYAVSSAYFLGTESNRLYYVASAPQASNQQGEAFIFDIEDFMKDKKIKVFNKFSGSQFGEYFGYTLLCEDFNNDGFPDLAITAPLHSKSGTVENGAVYIFINKGNLAFDQQDIITSEFSGNGRFGTTLAKIGDINLDGYNDLAVSAPFEDNGVVYIFLGSASGLSSKPSQRIEAPSELPNAFGESKSYFGHGMSRGVDIDGNEYKDIAIGSPNAESVYVFKTYPVVKIIASIIPSKNELTLEDNLVAIKVCINYESAGSMSRDIDVFTTLTLDKEYNRASFSPREFENQMNDTMKVTREEQCNDYTLVIKGTLIDIFKPMHIELKYELAEKIPEYEQAFCETCVVTDPRESKASSTKIAFATGCEGDRCLTDLAVVGTLINVRQPYVLGSAKTIEIKYDISNSGEAAYLTQMKIKIPTNVTQFSRIPSICSQEDNALDLMTCDLRSGRPLKNLESFDVTISLDATRLEGTFFSVTAEVSSAGDEQRPSDNVYVNEILLTEFSDVELNGQSSLVQHSIEHGVGIENVQYVYKIFNNGPSTIKELALSIHIPLTFIPRANFHIPIIDHNEIDIQGLYNYKIYEPTLNKDDTNVISDHTSNDNLMIIGTDMNHNFDSSKLGFDYDFNKDQTPPDFQTLGETNHRRRRRRSLIQQTSEDGNIYRVYNQYTNEIDEYHASYRVSADHEDHTLANLPKNRTIFFDCGSSSENVNECIEAQFRFLNFRPGSEPIIINLNFSLDMSKIASVFNEDQDIFVFKTNAVLQRVGDSQKKTLRITTRNPYTMIYEKMSKRTPIWLWIVSILVGLLLLILLCYTLYRLGFFKRTQKEELERLTRESMKVTSEEAEELKNLNA